MLSNLSKNCLTSNKRAVNFWTSLQNPQSTPSQGGTVLVSSFFEFNLTSRAGRCSGLMVSALVPGSSGLSSSPGG